MIYFNLVIRTPWNVKFKNLCSRFGKISKHKAWEVEVIRDNILFEFEFKFNLRGDHAGTKIGVGLFGHSVYAQYYDTRHWDYEKNSWCVYE